MNNRNYYQYLAKYSAKYLATAIAALSIQTKTLAETKPTTTQDASSKPSLSFNRSSDSDWENAVLDRTLDSLTTINMLKFSPDGLTLAGVGASQITLWQAANGQVQSILPGHFATELQLEIAPTAIAFSPDSQFLATATWSQGLLSPDQSILVRDIATGAEVLKISEPDGCRQVIFDPTGEVLYGACGRQVTAWSFPAGEKLFSWDTKYPVEAIAISQDGKTIATADTDIANTDIPNANTLEKQKQNTDQTNQIQIWQLEQDQPSLLNTLDGHSSNIAQLEFTANGSQLISSSYDGKINVWNWRTGATSRGTNGLQSKNGMFSLNSSSQLIAGTFHSSAMTSLNTGLPLRKTMSINRQGKASAIAFNPAGDMFVRAARGSKSQPSQIQFWQTKPNKSSKSAAETKKSQYLSLPISEYWGNQEQPGGESTLKLDTKNPSPVGDDPEDIALAALGLEELVESEQQIVELAEQIAPNENSTFVTIKQKNLADDSLAAISYLVQFAPYGDRANRKWRVVWAGQKFKCQTNRGHQDWGIQSCQ